MIKTMTRRRRRRRRVPTAAYLIKAIEMGYVLV